jgi:hypothetical protein
MTSAATIWASVCNELSTAYLNKEPQDYSIKKRRVYHLLNILKFEVLLIFFKFRSQPVTIPKIKSVNAVKENNSCLLSE